MPETPGVFIYQFIVVFETTHSSVTTNRLTSVQISVQKAQKFEFSCKEIPALHSVPLEYRWQKGIKNAKMVSQQSKP